VVALSRPSPWALASASSRASLPRDELNGRRTLGVEADAKW
jgi:hypothetical protein